MAIITAGRTGFVFAWGFKFENVPEPPSGFNQPTQPGDPADVHPGKIEFIDPNDSQFEKWLRKATSLGSVPEPFTHAEYMYKFLNNGLYHEIPNANH